MIEHFQIGISEMSLYVTEKSETFGLTSFKWNFLKFYTSISSPKNRWEVKGKETISQNVK